MIHVVAMKCLVGLPLVIHIELLWRSLSRSFKNRGVGVGSFKNRGVGVGSFKNRGVGVGVGAFVYRLHSPVYNSEYLFISYDDDHTVYFDDHPNKRRFFPTFTITRLVFVMGMYCVYFEVWTEFFDVCVDFLIQTVRWQSCSWVVWNYSPNLSKLPSLSVDDSRSRVPSYHQLVKLENVNWTSHLTRFGCQTSCSKQ
jgi:hypothetical protein